MEEEDKLKQPLDPSPASSDHHPPRLLLADQAHNGKMNGGDLDLAVVATKVNKGPPKWRSQRYILGYFLFAGMSNLFFQRVNLSVAIVCMVNQTAVSRHGSHLRDNASGPSSQWTYVVEGNTSDAGRPLLTDRLFNASFLSPAVTADNTGIEVKKSEDVDRCMADELSKGRPFRVDETRAGSFAWGHLLDI